MALVLGLIRRTPYVYDVQDLWPEALVATGNVRSSSLIERCIDGLCGLIYKHASRIVVFSDGYQKALILKGVPLQKIERISSTGATKVE